MILRLEKGELQKLTTLHEYTGNKFVDNVEDDEEQRMFGEIIRSAGIWAAIIIVIGGIFFWRKRKAAKWA